MKLRLRGARQVVQIHPTGKRQNQDLNLVLSGSIYAIFMNYPIVRFKAKQSQMEIISKHVEIVNFKPSFLFLFVCFVFINGYAWPIIQPES